MDSFELWWRVTGKGYVIRLKELCKVDKWITQLLKPQYTRAVYFASLDIHAAIDLWLLRP